MWDARPGVAVDRLLAGCTRRETRSPGAHGDACFGYRWCRVQVLRRTKVVRSIASSRRDRSVGSGSVGVDGQQSGRASSRRSQGGGGVTRVQADPFFVNPLKPCGACMEWLKKIAEVNPDFKVITFTDTRCEGVFIEDVAHIA